MCKAVGCFSICESAGVLMNEELRVKYLLGDVEVKQIMNQMQLSDLLKQDDIFLLSVNESGSHYSPKRKRKK